MRFSPLWVAFFSFWLPPTIEAKESLLLPATAFDGGVKSVESLSRGQNFASSAGTPASASENPAALAALTEGSFYSTFFVGNDGSFSKRRMANANPLEDKVLQYFSLTSEQGAVYFEPVGRFQQTLPSDEDVDFYCNAIGFAGSSSFGAGASVGLSLAYLYGAYGTTRFESGAITSAEHDTANGVRLGLGARYPTGPFMWGIALQNVPGFLWWKDHKRNILPASVQIGNTWRMGPGFLLSVSGETRFYNEGGDREDYLKLGQEIPIGKSIVARAGIFGPHIDRPDGRHITGGLTLKGRGGTELSYAVESFKLEDKTVNKSYIALRYNFSGTAPSKRRGSIFNN